MCFIYIAYIYKLSKIDEIQCTILYGAAKKRTKMGMRISSGIIYHSIRGMFLLFPIAVHHFYRYRHHSVC